MLARLGFVSSVLSEDLSTSKTCRLANVTRQRLRELIAENLAALESVVGWLERHRVRLYRLSSNIIPFASHEANPLEWWREFAADFDRIGARMRELDIRISTHPGQYTVLNSMSPKIVSASVAELTYQAQLLDAFGASTACKIVLHIGGLYAGSKEIAIARLVENARLLPDAVKRRLVLENDDRLFNADDALVAARAIGVPVVFDWLHHTVNPSVTPAADVIRACFDTWKAGDGRPKVHISTPAAEGPRGAHADFVDAADIVSFLAVAPDVPFDCMLEAKQKDRALLQVREALRKLKIVESDLLPTASDRRAAPRVR